MATDHPASNRIPVSEALRAERISETPPRFRIPPIIWLNLLLGMVLGCQTWPGPVRLQNVPNARYEFALIGDTPYTPDIVEHDFPNLVHDLNQSRLAFVVHDGDIKSGSAPCTDEILEHRLKLFQTIEHPFVLIFGDNEWTDCGDEAKKSKSGGARHPQERLSKLRELFCPEHVSLGRHPIQLERQSENSDFPQCRENVRWFYGSVLYVGLNISGSGNNAQNPDEFLPRQKSNLAWMSESFQLAKHRRAHAIMLIIQANPKFEDKPESPTRKGFNDFLDRLRNETVAFEKPVVLVHGDSHYFRIDKPMMGAASGRRVENFTRVETFGNPDTHWLKVSVDWREPNIFTFRQRIVGANKVGH